MKVGRRLAIKILNASRFVLSMEAGPGDVTEPIDRSMLARARAASSARRRTAFEAYEHAKALDAIERFFWGFTDDYLELVKQRAYGGDPARGSRIGDRGAAAALDVLLRLFAPFLPYVTEEVWSWWREGSCTASTWPTGDGAVQGRRRGPGRLRGGGRACSRRSARRRRSRRCRCASRSTRVTVRDTAGPALRTARAGRRTTFAKPATSARSIRPRSAAGGRRSRTELAPAAETGLSDGGRSPKRSPSSTDAGSAHGARPVAHPRARHATCPTRSSRTPRSTSPARTARAPPRSVATEIACAHGLTTGLYTSPHLRVGHRTALGLRRRHDRSRSSPRSTRTCMPFLRTGRLPVPRSGSPTSRR